MRLRECRSRATQESVLALQSMEIVTRRLEELPVVRAWVGLGRGRHAPPRVELLGWKPKSIVFRLVGVGPAGADVIAKGCVRDTGLVERAIYADVLPHVLGGPVGYCGFAEAGDGRLCWLFLEDQGGEPFDPAIAEHRAVATRWLAVLHTRSARVAAAARLPDRGPGHYLDQMRAACRTIRENRANPVLTTEDRAVLDRTLAQFAFIESKWNAVEAACLQAPRSLVHGDFAERNLRLRRGRGGLALVAFDWEVAGWGLPAVDLAHADLPLYGATVRETWPSLDDGTLLRMAHLGRLLRGGLAAANWAVPNLATEWVEQPVTTLCFYQAQIAEDLRALGWLP